MLIILLLVSPGNLWTSQLKVGIIGDQTGASDLQYAYSILQKGVDVLKDQSPDILIHVGDLVESTKSDEEIRADYARSTSIIKRSRLPWFLTPGDHDVNPVNYQQNSSDRSKEELFQSLYRNDNPLVADHLYYSFDVKGNHFIALYALEHLHTDPRWGNVFFSEISNTQYEWLQDDLEKNIEKAAIIVFVHQPMWYNWSSWSRVHQLLSRYPVIAIIAGHYHYNQYEGELDGIKYLVVGATGGDVKNASTNAGGIHHVTIMTITGNKVDFFPLAVEPTTSVPMSFTSRLDMDRIQALDQILGNLWNFGTLNNVYLKDNQLVGDCSTCTPALLNLSSIGNAAEFQAEIILEYKPGSTSIVLTCSQFASGVCQPGSVTNLQCTLIPSARIYMANTSSVSTAPYSLWTGILGLSGAPPLQGTNICLNVTFSFQGIDGKIFTISSKYPACTQLKLCE
jgi:UDP-2,3-diacylglucosamine pyrophosphatase LpxH